MSSDVEMVVPVHEGGKNKMDLHEILDSESTPPRTPTSDAASSSPGTPVPPPPSSGHSTVDADEQSATTTDGPVKKEKKGKAPSSRAGPSNGAPSSAKPKSTKHARSPSPSPPPPPARPPPQTIRLEIKLGGPDNYEVDIAKLSKESGQRPSTPPPALLLKQQDVSDDSHSEGDDEGDGKSKEKKKRRKKKSAAQEYYDVTDPFIDDSELAIDERMYFAQTKQQGFYVSSGQVALLTDKSAGKKPKSKKLTVLPPAQSITAALSSAPLPASLSLAPKATVSDPSSSTSVVVSKVKREDGTKDSPITLYSNEDGMGDGDSVSAAGKRKAEEGEGGANGASKRKRLKELQPFHPELEEMIQELMVAIKAENWDNKGKFPPNLKPLLSKIALKAIILGEYDDNFFNLMPRIFPYNRFTMMKLIKRTIWRDHTDLLIGRQGTLLEELAKLAQEGFPKAQEEWEKSVAAWEKRQERAKADGGVEGDDPNSAQPTPTATSAPLPPSISISRSMDDGNDTAMEHDEPVSGVVSHAHASGKVKDTHPPPKRYRLTEQMKSIIWQLVCLSNEVCRIENEKNQLENNNQVVSDQGVRKNLYQKIVAAFPDGWLTSGQISREVSVMKKKYEKEVAENES